MYFVYFTCTLAMVVVKNRSMSKCRVPVTNTWYLVYVFGCGSHVTVVTVKQEFQSCDQLSECG